MQFKVDGEATELASITFVIGGTPFEVPVLNLEANLVALDLMPKAEGAAQQFDAALRTIEARMQSVDGSPLTAKFIRTRLTGRAEFDAFNDAMLKLMEISGLYTPEVEVAASGEAPAEEAPATT